MLPIDLRLGRWQSVLADVTADTLIADGPYGSSTHAATNDHIAGSALPDGVNRQSINYACWTPEDVHEFVASWSPRIRGWMCCFTSDDLAQSYKAAYARAGRYAFAPLPIIQPRPRLIGDGPASWTVWLMVARPRSREFATWGCLPGEYRSRTDKTGIVAGAKPVELMRGIVRDYSRPGDLIVDPCAGGATTLLAARLEGRRSIGAEVDPETYRKALARCAELPVGDGKQCALFGG